MKIKIKDCKKAFKQVGVLTLSEFKKMKSESKKWTTHHRDTIYCVHPVVKMNVKRIAKDCEILKEKNNGIYLGKNYYIMNWVAQHYSYRQINVHFRLIAPEKFAVKHVWWIIHDYTKRFSWEY